MTQVNSRLQAQLKPHQSTQRLKQAHCTNNSAERKKPNLSLKIGLFKKRKSLNRKGMKKIIEPTFRFIIAILMVVADFLMAKTIQFWMFIWFFSNEPFKIFFPKQEYFFQPEYENHYYKTFSDFVFNIKSYKK